MLAYNALKPKDLSHLVDSRIGNPDADPTDINEGYDFTTWSALGPASADDADSFTSTGNGGMYKNMLTVGKTYFFKIAITTTAVSWSVRAVNIGGAGTIIGTADGWYVYTPISDETYLYVRNSGAGVTDVTILEVQEWNGEELKPDPDVGFVANDVSKWTAYGVNTLAQDGNTVKITYVDNDNGGYVYIRNTTDGTTFNNRSIGDKIRVVFRAKVNQNTTTVYLTDAGGGGQSEIDVSTTTYETFILDWTVANPSVYIRQNGMVAGDIFNIEILSVMKVTGLVAAYNMIPNGSTLVDISGNNKNANYDALNIKNPVSSKDGMSFLNGTFSRTTLADISLNKYYTICVRFKPEDYASRLQIVVGNASSGTDRNGISISTGGTLTFATYDGSYNETGETSYIIDGKWITMVCINYGSLTGKKAYINGIEAGSASVNALGGIASGLEIGGDNSVRNFIGEIADLRFYNYAFSEQEAIDYHNQFAKQVSQKHAFDDLGVGSTIG